MTRWYHIMARPVGYPQPEGNFGYRKATFDGSDACLTCDIGLRQNNPFRLREAPRSLRHQFIGLHWVFDQVFVAQMVKDLFEKEGVRGVRYTQPVIHRSGAPIEGWYQLQVDELITDGLMTDDLRTEVCALPQDEATLRFLRANGSRLATGPFCGQTKYNLPQGENRLRMRASALSGSTGLVRLGYWFGSGGSANRPILISERVKGIMDREKWKGAVLQEVELV